MCLLALAWLAMPALAQNAKGRSITGTVLDIDAKPVAHATVAVAGGGPSTTTGDDGGFKLAGVATANVVLEVTADGFTAKQVPVLGAATPLQLSVVIVKPAPAAPPPSETRMVGGVVVDASRHLRALLDHAHGVLSSRISAALRAAYPSMFRCAFSLTARAPSGTSSLITAPAPV